MRVLVKRAQRDTHVKHLETNAVAIKGEMKLESRLHNQSNTSHEREAEALRTALASEKSAKALEESYVDKKQRTLVPKRTFYTECQCRYSCSNCKTKSNY
jgi:hypothetical protein